MSENMDFGAPQGETSALPNEPGKKRCIDDIIEHMTADLQSYEGQYILLGSPPSTGHPGWTSPQQPVVHCQPVRENNEMMMMDVRGGKYVVFSKHPTQEFNQPVGFIRYQQPPQDILKPRIIDYGHRYCAHLSLNQHLNCCNSSKILSIWS